jgi:hypothetical protein
VDLEEKILRYFQHRGAKMMERRQLNGRKVINDLRSGASDWDLRVKYKLSCNSLQTVFEKLVAYGAISHSELCNRSPVYKETTERKWSRKDRRVDLNIPVPVPIYDMETLSAGLLRDVSEIGLRVAGIESSVGQVKTFQIPVNVFMQTDPVFMVAECKWVELRGKNKELFVAGFEIIDLSDKDRKALRQFMGLLVLDESGEWRTGG